MRSLEEMLGNRATENIILDLSRGPMLSYRDTIGNYPPIGYRDTI